MRRNRAATEITRTRVLQAALEAFAASGVRATTLENVARLAGVTRGAVYWHFENKAALEAAIIDQLRRPMDIGPDMVAYQAHPEPLQLAKGKQSKVSHRGLDRLRLDANLFQEGRPLRVKHRLHAEQGQLGPRC